MSKTLSTILLALAVVGGTAVFDLSGIAAAVTDLSTDAMGLACDQTSDPPENLPEGVIFLAQQGKNYKCLENCSDNRYQCEKSNKDKNKVGTKNNWDESTKCQAKYTDCLDRCE